MTQAHLSRAIYVINDLRIEQTTYRDYLREYWSDEVTSPNGVEPRLFVRETDGQYELRQWSGSRSILLRTFETEEDAELERYAYWDRDYQNGNSNAPSFEESYEQAIETIAERTGKSIPVIHRYMAFQALADRRAEIKAAEYEKRQEELWQAIIAEADEITPDEQLLLEVRAAKKIANNDEKTKALAAAQVAFLHRIGHYPIRTDFWRVFKIVNKKSLQYDAHCE